MNSEHKSYSRILKSSSLIGGAQGINMLIGMVRIKIVALLIGPVGIGLVETYRSIVQLVSAVSGLGLQSSAVRDIAVAVGNGDRQQIGRIVLTLRRMYWLTGGVGFLCVALLSKKLSLITFSNTDHIVEIAAVGVTVLFANVQGGQMALLQGMRRIDYLARLNVTGVFAGSIISVGLYLWLGMRGIVPAIISLGLIQLIVSWWFARKVVVPKVEMSWRESFREAGGMVRLGLAFMWSGALTMGVAYATRAVIAREIDLIAVGIFSAAYSLSGLIVNFVLGAMGADYYPGLAAVNTDHGRMRNLVNQQTEIGLLLALPGLLATMAFAPWAIRIFYTADFWQASDLLQWFALGCLGRVISWPLGFIVLAKEASALFAVTQTLFNLIHMLLIVLGLTFLGIEGVAVAFALLYSITTVVNLVISKYMIDFSWSRGVWSLLGIMFPVIAVVFIAGKFLPEITASIIGLVVTAGVSMYCLFGLTQRLADDHRICRIIRKLPLLNLMIRKKESTE